MYQHFTPTKCESRFGCVCVVMWFGWFTRIPDCSVGADAAVAVPGSRDQRGPAGQRSRSHLGSWSRSTMWQRELELLSSGEFGLECNLVVKRAGAHWM